MADGRTSNEEIVKTLKENTELLQFVGSLRKEEIKEIKDQRKFDEIEPETMRYKIAVLCHPFRQALKTAQQKLNNTLWNISVLNNSLKRLQVQLVSKNITEEIKTGMVMNEDELEALIKDKKDSISKQFDSVRLTLAEFSGLVGKKDYIRKVVLPEDKFDAIVKDTEKQLKAYGFKLFGELDE